MDSLNKKIAHFFHVRAKPRYYRNPYKDWGIMLLTFCLLCIVLVAVDGYIFYKINRGELFAVSQKSGPQVQSFDRALLQQESDLFTAQDQKFTAIQSASSTVIDPSL